MYDFNCKGEGDGVRTGWRIWKLRGSKTWSGRSFTGLLSSAARKDLANVSSAIVVESRLAWSEC